jgi:hypothetical protein
MVELYIHSSIRYHDAVFNSLINEVQRQIYLIYLTLEAYGTTAVLTSVRWKCLQV